MNSLARALKLMSLPVFLAASMGPATAQQPKWWPNGTPNRLPDRQANFSCLSFKEIARSGDPIIMEALSGIWENDTTMRTLVEATPVHQRVQRFSSGELLYDNSACFASPIGGAPSCSHWGGHGYWTARMADDGSVIFANWLQGTGPTGDPEAPSCASFPLRLLDENTIQFQDGSTVQRTGN